MKRYLKALWSHDAVSCLTGGAIFCGAFYGAPGAVIGGLAGAALGAWCACRQNG